MNKVEVGELIGNVRKNRNVSAEKLCNGVCTQTVLYRLETKGQIPDMVIFERLLSRLGISANKVEILLQYREYELYVLQEQIEQALEQCDYDKAKLLLREYSEQEEIEQPIREQYYRKMKAVLDRAKGVKAEKIMAELGEILCITLPDFSVNQIDNYLMAEEEWILVLMWLEQKMIVQSEEAGKECLQILRYMERRDWDEEMLLRIYPKMVWLYAQKSNMDKQETLELCEKAIRMLTKNGVLMYLPQLLELRCNIWNTMQDDTLLAKRAEEESAVLKWMYEMSGEKYPAIEIQMWKTFKHNDIFLLPETIKMERKSLGKSQEELAWDAAVDQKTLSRIETGIHVPKQGTYDKIKQVMPACRNLYTTAVIVDDFELLELKREIAHEMLLAHWNKAQELFDMLCQKISMEEKENRQYVLFMQTLLHYRKQEIDREHALKEALWAFEQTRKFDIDKISQVVLSENEANTSNFIAQMYRELGDEKKAIEILESVLAGYDSSNMPETCHYRAITVILLKLSYYCETSDMFEKAMAYCERGLRLQFKCHRVNLIGDYLMQKYYIRERMGLEGKDRREFYVNLYRLNRLQKDEAGLQSAKRGYERRYGEMPKC